MVQGGRGHPNTDHSEELSEHLDEHEERRQPVVKRSQELQMANLHRVVHDVEDLPLHADNLY